jgi:thioredoxin 1
MANSPTHSGGDGGPTAPQVQTGDEFEQLLAANETVLVDFYADWCGPCQVMAPTVDELASESEAAVVKVNVEELPDVAARFDVSSIPAFVVFRDGDLVDRFVGAQDKETLRRAIER